MSEELFDVNKMEKSLKKAQRKSILKTIIISASVILLLAIVSLFINRKFTDVTSSWTRNAYVAYHSISSPNELISTMEFYDGILGGEVHYKTFKLIDDKVVYTGEGGYGYGLFRDEFLNRTGWGSSILFSGLSNEEDIEKPSYNELGQRTMAFFYPSASYKAVTNDLAKLNEIDDDKLVEVGLSFDKGYSVTEALDLFNTIEPSWLWVRDVTEEESKKKYERLASDGSTIMSSLIRNEHNVYGFSLIDNNGERLENPTQQFATFIGTGLKHKSIWHDEFERLVEVIGGEDGIQKEDIVIYGAVVSGTAAELKALQQAPFVRASSFGVITDRY